VVANETTPDARIHLIELPVVIAIRGILAAMLLPSAGKSEGVGEKGDLHE